MNTGTWSLRRLHAVDDAQIDALADMLIDCVEGGASVSFMHPLPRERAVAFWRRVAEDVVARKRALLVAEDAQGLCGTVQLIFDLQLAHFTCLAAARHAVLRDAGWDVNADGLFGAPKIRIITSDQRHVSVDRALRFLGFGNRSVVTIPTTQNGEIDSVAFQAVVATGASPTIVVLNAGDLNMGAFDPFEKLIPVAKAAGAWVHIDGAFGLMARASRSKRPLLAGIELADSWATDGHKWLNVPYDSGLAFVRDHEAHRASMTASASYIAAHGNARDQLDWNPEWSRRGRGFAIYAALRELGRNGMEEMIGCSNFGSAGP